MKYLLICALLGITLGGCQTSPKQDITGKQKIRYQSDWKSLPGHLKDFFPEKIPAAAQSMVNMGKNFDLKLGWRWEVLFNTDPAFCRDLLEKAGPQALQKGPSGAAYLRINHRFSHAPQYHKTDRPDLKTYPYPVPCFQTYAGPSERDRLPDGFEILIMYADKGSEPQLDWQEPFNWGVAVSEDWRKGECTGLAINPKAGKVIYWAEAW